MTRNVAYLLRGGALLLACSLAISASALWGTTHPAAIADEGEDLHMTAYELQQEIEARQAAYAEARQEADSAAESIEKTEARIAELEKQIPEQQQRSAKAVREEYKLQQQGAGIVDLLLGANTFSDFLHSFEYMNRISDANAAEMNRLSKLKDQILAEQEGLKTARREADAKAEDARAAMEAAQEAQAEVQRRIEEEARAQAEIAAMAQTLAEEERNNDTGAPAAAASADNSGNSGDSGDSGNVENSDNADETTSEDVATPDSSDDSLDGWTKRIDAYLAGSPLAGQGKTFAQAAINYGVDPRLSPAISFTESSKGLYCFKSHNAWGWGSSSWNSWEDAINAHVAGLASGYGGQLTIEGAKKYCPPNWKTWYDRTLAQMNLI